MAGRSFRACYARRNMHSVSLGRGRLEEYTSGNLVGGSHPQKMGIPPPNKVSLDDICQTNHSFNSWYDIGVLIVT